MGLKACAIWGNRRAISWLIWTLFVAVNITTFTTTAFVTMDLYSEHFFGPIILLYTTHHFPLILRILPHPLEYHGLISDVHLHCYSRSQLRKYPVLSDWALLLGHEYSIIFLVNTSGTAFVRYRRHWGTLSQGLSSSGYPIRTWFTSRKHQRYLIL
jgi:hypothetical protein